MAVFGLLLLVFIFIILHLKKSAQRLKNANMRQNDSSGAAAAIVSQPVVVSANPSHEIVIAPKKADAASGSAPEIVVAGPSGAA